MNKFTVSLERLDSLLDNPKHLTVFDAKKDTATALYPDVYLTCKFVVNEFLSVETQLRIRKLTGRNYTGICGYRYYLDGAVSSDRSELVTQYYFDHETALEDFVDFTRKTQANALRYYEIAKAMSE